MFSYSGDYYDTYKNLIIAMMDDPEAAELYGYYLVKPDQHVLERLIIAFDEAVSLSLVNDPRRFLADYADEILDVNRYSTKFREALEAEFPILRLEMRYTIPKPFSQSKGVLRWVEYKTLQLQDKLTIGRSRLPVICIYQATPTAFRFPWQQAISFGWGLARGQFSRIDSSYAVVCGTKQYRASYISNVPDHFTPRNTVRTERIMIPIMVEGGQEFRVMAAAQRLADVESAFDQLIESFE